MLVPYTGGTRYHIAWYPDLSQLEHWLKETASKAIYINRMCGFKRLGNSYHHGKNLDKASADYMVGITQFNEFTLPLDTATLQYR